MFNIQKCDLIKTKDRIAVVNGVAVNAPDFGEYKHDKPIDIEFPTFTPGPSTEHVLKRYGITEEEYLEIQKFIQSYFEEMKNHFVMRESFWQEGRDDFKPVTRMEKGLGKF